MLSVAIAIAAAYGGLRAFLARQDGIHCLIAVAFGFAVSGMHYTAMYGMHFVPPSEVPITMSTAWPRRSKFSR